MSKASLTSLTVACAALAACSDSPTTRTVTAPDARPSLSEAAADLGVSYTPDGPADVGSAGEDASAQPAGAQLLGAQLAAAPQAASGSRATGHVAFPTGVPGTVITSEKYSFTSLSTDPATPLAAKGHFEITLATSVGIEQKIHGDVTCMITFGNTARVVGQITKFWVNGVQSPILPARTHAFWVVVDNGEGPGVDQVSAARFSNAAIAQTYCTSGFLSTVFPNAEGNVQVQP